MFNLGVKMTKQPSVARREGQKPERVVVRQRVDVDLSMEEIYHALRCWISHGGAAGIAPKHKDFNAITISWNYVTNEHHEPEFIGATLTYEPEPTSPQTVLGTPSELPNTDENK